MANYRRFATYVTLYELYDTVMPDSLFSLSAHLSLLTSNATFTGAAILSATFIRDHLTGPLDLIYNLITLEGCIIDSTTMKSVNSALAVEAWSVTADASQDTQWQEQYVSWFIFLNFTCCRLILF